MGLSIVRTQVSALVEEGGDPDDPNVESELSETASIIYVPVILM